MYGGVVHALDLAAPLLLVAWIAASLLARRSNRAGTWYVCLVLTITAFLLYAFLFATLDDRSLLLNVVFWMIALLLLLGAVANGVDLWGLATGNPDASPSRLREKAAVRWRPPRRGSTTEQATANGACGDQRTWCRSSAPLPRH
jgi:hypothetical protein